MTGRLRGRRRDLTPEERRLWRAFTADVERHNADPGEPEPDLEADEEPRSHQPARAEPDRPSQSRTSTVARPAPVQAAATAPPMQPLEARKARKLAAGHLEIEARLDLHGMTQAEAHAQLRAFIASAHRRELRFVKVITGKGSKDGDAGATGFFSEGRGRGVLRRMVPQWLAAPEMRAMVVSFATAGRGHGGDGALYVHIRRKGRT